MKQSQTVTLPGSQYAMSTIDCAVLVCRKNLINCTYIVVHVGKSLTKDNDQYVCTLNCNYTHNMCCSMHLQPQC